MGAAAVPIGLGALSLFGQARAAKEQRRAQEPQRQLAMNQRELFQQTAPWLNPILQALAGNAGLQAPGGAPGGPGPAGSLTPHLPMGSTAMPESALGIYGSNPADRYRFAQAEGDLERIRKQRNAELLLGLHNQGAGTATIGSAMARNEGQYQEGLAGSRRELAINSGNEATQRVLQLLGALSPGLGLGQSAAGIFGDQAGLAAGRSNALAGTTGDALSAYLMYQAMKRQQQGQPAPPPFARSGANAGMHPFG